MISPSSRLSDLGFFLRLLLPSSLISNAMSVAKRLSFVFKLILYAIKNSLHPITVAPANLSGAQHHNQVSNLLFLIY